MPEETEENENPCPICGCELEWDDFEALYYCPALDCQYTMLYELNLGAPKEVSVGDKMLWIDPDNGKCIRVFVVAAYSYITEDSTDISIVDTEGGEVICPVVELRRLEGDNTIKCPVCQRVYRRDELSEQETEQINDWEGCIALSCGKDED